MQWLEKLEDDQGRQLWEDFALNKPAHRDIGLNPAFFDLYSKHSGLTPYYLLLESVNQTVGLFPVVREGKKFCSLPHLSYGGVYWMSNFKYDDEESIIKRITMALTDLCPERGFYRLIMDHLNNSDTGKPDIEIRSRVPFFGEPDTPKVIHKIRLDHSGDIASRFSSNVRRKIAKAEKTGVAVKKGGQELVPDFTKVYNRNIQRIGSPTLGERFFRAIAAQTDLNAEVFVAYLKGKPIGGSFSMRYDRYYENLWFATLSDYNKFYTSYLLHAEMIKSAIQHHSADYSLGRSTKDSGVFHYKQQWPVEEVPVYFSRSVRGGFSLKQQKWLSELWKYVPPPVADTIGPFFAKKMY